MNTTIKVYLPSIIVPPYHNAPLSEQAEYDLRNSLRKSYEFNDFDDDDEDEDDDIEFVQSFVTSTVALPTTVTTASSTTTKAVLLPVDIHAEPMLVSSTSVLSTRPYLFVLPAILLTQTRSK